MIEGKLKKIKCLICDDGTNFCKHKPALYQDGSYDFNLELNNKKYIVMVYGDIVSIIEKKRGKIKLNAEVICELPITKEKIFKIIDNLIFI